MAPFFLGFSWWRLVPLIGEFAFITQRSRVQIPAQCFSNNPNNLKARAEIGVQILAVREADARTRFSDLNSISP
jgi:hypothetical protein